MSWHPFLVLHRVIGNLLASARLEHREAEDLERTLLEFIIQRETLGRPGSFS